MSDLTEPFTESSLRELYDHVDRSYQPDRELAAQMTELYWGKQPVKMQDTTAKGRSLKLNPVKMYTQEGARVNNLITSFFTQRADVGVKWAGEKARAESVAEKLEVGIAAGVSQMDEQFAYPRNDRIKGQILYGKGAQLGPMVGGNYYWDFPYGEEGETSASWKKRYEDWYKSGPLPLAYVSLPSDSAFPASLGLTKDLCTATLSVSKYELKEMFGDDAVNEALTGASEKAGQVYTLFMASNRQHLVYCLMDVAGKGLAGTGVFSRHNDRIIRQCKHGMGTSVIRIHEGMTGSRHKSANGLGYYWLPVLHFVAELIKGADNLLSMAATAQKFDALPPLARFTSRDMQQSGAAGEITQEEWGGILDFTADDSGKKLSWMEPIIQPRFGEKTQALLMWVLNRTGLISGASPVLEGMSSEDTAWATHQMIKIVTQKHSPLTKSVQVADEDDVEMLMRSVEKHGHPVDVYGDDGKGVMLIPDQMSGWRARAKAEYEPNVPKSEVALWQTGIDLMERSMRSNLPISPRWVMEDVMGIQQPVTHYREAIFWRALLLPEVLQRQMVRYLDEADATLSEEDEGMSVEEMMREYSKLSPERQARIAAPVAALQHYAARAAVRAGVPFSAQPGGPQPEAMPELVTGAGRTPVA
jgi:hypothetical protein